jgi:hypothetical protein
LLKRLGNLVAKTSRARPDMKFLGSEYDILDRLARTTRSDSELTELEAILGALVQNAETHLLVEATFH